MNPIFQGDSKAAIIEVLIEGVADIVAWTAKVLLIPGAPLRISTPAVLSIPCVYVDATHVKMEMSTTQSATLSPGTYTCLLRVENAATAKRLTYELGPLTVNPDPEEE